MMVDGTVLRMVRAVATNDKRKDEREDESLNLQSVCGQPLILATLQ